MSTKLGAHFLIENQLDSGFRGEFQVSTEPFSWKGKEHSTRNRRHFSAQNECRIFRPSTKLSIRLEAENWGCFRVGLHSFEKGLKIKRELHSASSTKWSRNIARIPRNLPWGGRGLVPEFPKPQFWWKGLEDKTWHWPLLNTKWAQNFAPILGSKFILGGGYVAMTPPDVLWYISKGFAARSVGFATLFSRKQTQNFDVNFGQNSNGEGGKATDLVKVTVEEL